jgi:hypothetical protein
MMKKQERDKETNLLLLQRPRNKQDNSGCYATTARWAHIPGPFLDNSSVNTFAQQQTRTQQYKSCVFYVVRAERLSWRQVGTPSQLLVDSSVRESVRVCEQKTWFGGRIIAITGARKRLVTDWDHYAVSSSDPCSVKISDIVIVMCS